MQNTAESSPAMQMVLCIARVHSVLILRPCEFQPVSQDSCLPPTILQATMWLETLPALSQTQVLEKQEIILGSSAARAGEKTISLLPSL